MAPEDPERMQIKSELKWSEACVQLIQFNHRGPTEYNFRRDDVFWIDMCVTPRRPNERARYVDHWVPHRFTRLGSVIVLLPGERLQLMSAGGRRTSLVCQINVDAVLHWLPDNFHFTDRRLEACLDIASPEISGHMQRLAREMRQHETGWEHLAEALVQQLSVELARYLIGVTDADERGSMAAWRLRLIDKRLARPGPPPSLTELAEMCNMSVRQLTRSFRTTRGCTIGEFFNQGRIEEAKRRLGTGESIKSIADNLGFSSQANFSSAFLRATGNTPNAFRTRVLRGGERSVG